MRTTQLLGAHGQAGMPDDKQASGNAKHSDKLLNGLQKEGKGGPRKGREDRRKDFDTECSLSARWVQTSQSTLGI